MGAFPFFIFTGSSPRGGVAVRRCPKCGEPIPDDEGFWERNFYLLPMLVVLVMLTIVSFIIWAADHSIGMNDLTYHAWVWQHIVEFCKLLKEL